MTFEPKPSLTQDLQQSEDELIVAKSSTPSLNAGILDENELGGRTAGRSVDKATQDLQQSEDELIVAKRTSLIGIIDYAGGNLQSVRRSIEFLGYNCVWVHGPEDFKKITHLVFPGQGTFGDTMKQLRAKNLEPSILEWVAEDKPFLGICIGYQVLFESSTESPGINGLGIFKGQVRKFKVTQEHGETLKIPHMGWNTATIQNNHNYAKELPNEPYFYFVHSYFPEVVDRSIIFATSHYGEPFDAAVAKGHLLATQFHPEKSQDNGLNLIKSFFEINS